MSITLLMKPIASVAILLSLFFTVTISASAEECSCRTVTVHCSTAKVLENCGPGAGACVNRSETDPGESRHCPVFLTERNCEALGLREGTTDTATLRSAVLSPDLGLHCRETFFNPLRLTREDLKNGADCCIVAHELSHVFSTLCIQSGVAAACEEVNAEGVENRCTKDITQDWCSRAIASGVPTNIETCAMWCVNTVLAASVLENDRCVCETGRRDPPLNESHCASCAGICRQFGQDNMPRVCLSPTIMNRSIVLPQLGSSPPRNVLVSQLYSEVNTEVCGALSTGQFSHSCPSYLPPPALMVDPLLSGTADDPAPPAPPGPCNALTGQVCPTKYPAPTIDPINASGSCAPVLKWSPRPTSGKSAPYYKYWFAEIQRSASGAVNPVPSTVREEIVRFPSKRRSNVHTDIGAEDGKQYRRLQSGKRYRFAVASCADRNCSRAGMSTWTMRDFTTDGTLTTRCTPVEPKSILSVSKVGEGTVVSTNAAINCGSVCRAELPRTAQVLLSATPARGFVFSGWSGACLGTQSCSVRMDQNRIVTARFDSAPTRYNLSVTTRGNGAVESGGREIVCPQNCTTNFARNAVVTLRAIPGPSSRLVGWSSGCKNIGANGSTCTVVMSQARSITATFEAPPPTRIVRVNKVGNGFGTVLSWPQGLNCGPTCSMPFPQTTTVTLSAMPAAGSVFLGWEGADCAGRGSCTVSQRADQSVVARFERR